MVSKVKKPTNPVIDNSKHFKITGTITHSLYAIGDPKTGKITQEYRVEKSWIK